MEVEKLKSEALQLSPEARVYLVKELLTSLDVMSEAEIEKLWIDEAVRRDEELDAGRAIAHPAEEVFARARASRK